MTTDNWKPSERTRHQPRRRPKAVVEATSEQIVTFLTGGQAVTEISDSEYVRRLENDVMRLEAANKQMIINHDVMLAAGREIERLQRRIDTLEGLLGEANIAVPEPGS